MSGDETDISRGNDHLSKGEYDQAIAVFSEAIRQDPTNPAAWWGRGEATHLYRDDADAAIADYTEAIRLAPQPNPDWYFDLASALLLEALQAFRFRLDEPQTHSLCSQAVAHLSECLRLIPTDVRSYWKRGEAHLYRGEHGQAAADWGEAVRLDPQNVTYRWSRIHTQGDYDYYIPDIHDRAADCWTEYIRLNPGHQLAYHLRGDARRDGGHLDAAIGDYTEAIRLDTDPELTRLSYYQRAQSHLDRAIADLDETIRLNPHDALAFQLRAAVLRAKSGEEYTARDEEAAKLLDEAPLRDTLKRTRTSTQ